MNKVLIGKKSLVKIGDQEFVVDGIYIASSPSRVPAQEREVWSGTFEPVNTRPPVIRYEDDEEYDDNCYEDCYD